MAHDQHQHEASSRDYYTEQLLTIFVVGLLGIVGVLMYRNGQLGYILALPFHRPVLIGGVALLVLVVIRAANVWREAGHQHDHNCGSRHHEPDHGHDFTWVSSRLLVLSFPVGLFLIGVPNSGFSQDRIRMILGGDDALSGDLAAVAHRNGTVTTFNELNDAANDEERRERLQGQTAVLEGRIRWISTRQFTLYRLRMTCCAADVVPLKARIVLKSGTLSGFDDGVWVQMKGQIQFVQAPNSERFIPVVVVEDDRDIRKTGPKNDYD